MTHMHFGEELIALNVVKETKEDVITLLAQRLKQQGYVKDSFLDAILAREQVYPTGLPLKSFGVAIPHTDVIHVEKPSMAVAVLQNPVRFQMMGNPETDVMAEIVFVLAVKDPNEQIVMLERLMNLFQNDAKMEELRQVTTAKQACELITKELLVSPSGGVSAK